MNEYIKILFDPHFQWHKHICSHMKRAGFCAFDIAVNVYLVDQDLQDLKTKWKTKSAFTSLIDIYPDNAEYTIDIMVSDFISILEHIMNKHMIQWQIRHLYFLLAGGSFPATYLAS